MAAGPCTVRGRKQDKATSVCVSAGSFAMSALLFKTPDTRSLVGLHHLLTCLWGQCREPDWGVWEVVKLVLMGLLWGAFCALGGSRLNVARQMVGQQCGHARDSQLEEKIELRMPGQ